MPAPGKRLKVPAIATQILLIVCAVTSVLSIATEIFGISAATDFLNGGPDALDRLSQYDRLVTLGGWSGTSALLVTGLTWSVWQYRCAARVASRLRRSPRWHAGSWFVPSDELFRGLRVRPAGADTIGARYDVDVPIERILDVNIQQFRRLGLPVQRWTQARAKLVGTLVPTRMWLDSENRPVQTDQDYSAVASAGGSEYGLAGHSTVISNAWNAIPSIAEPPESETMTAEDALLPRINRTTLEKQIQDQMTRPGQSVSSVSCGTSLPVRVGATTACNVWVDGVAYPMYATTTSVTGTSVHYKIS